MKNSAVILFLAIAFAFSSRAQEIRESDSIQSDTVKNIRFNYKQLIIPSVLIGYGAIGMGNGQLKSFNSQLRNEVRENIDKKITIDDFTRYAPAVSVYGLNALGIEGKNNLRDRSVILLTSQLIMAGTVFGLKSVTNIERPDGSDNNSFPSGHTATAFAGAEFLWQEYKDKSIWYGIAGYAVAMGTGAFRIYNDKHWLTDVAAGAGIGILSTKIAYWINPYLTRTLFKNKDKKTASMIMPSYDGTHFGIGFARTF